MLIKCKTAIQYQVCVADAVEISIHMTSVQHVIENAINATQMGTMQYSVSQNTRSKLKKSSQISNSKQPYWVKQVDAALENECDASQDSFYISQVRSSAGLKGQKSRNSSQCSWHKNLILRLI